MKYGHKWHKWLREWQRGYIILHKKMKFSIKDFFSKGYQIRRILRNWSHLLKKPLMENFIFLCSIIHWSYSFKTTFKGFAEIYSRTSTEQCTFWWDFFLWLLDVRKSLDNYLVNVSNKKSYKIMRISISSASVMNFQHDLQKVAFSKNIV